MSIIKWIEQWFAEHCNEDWEHQYGITIGTLDNPGWKVAVALKETELENLVVEYVLWLRRSDEIRSNITEIQGDSRSVPA